MFPILFFCVYVWLNGKCCDPCDQSRFVVVVVAVVYSRIMIYAQCARLLPPVGPTFCAPGDPVDLVDSRLWLLLLLFWRLPTPTLPSIVMLLLLLLSFDPFPLVVSTPPIVPPPNAVLAMPGGVPMGSGGIIIVAAAPTTWLSAGTEWC